MKRSRACAPSFDQFFFESFCDLCATSVPSVFGSPPSTGRDAAALRHNRAMTRLLPLAAVLLAACATPPAPPITTPSGLVYQSLREGAGPSPAATDTVRVHYRGTLPTGKEFDSSYARNEPAEFPLNRVIKCWTEGVQRMKVG